MIEGHCENWPIRSTRFRTRFRHRYYRAAGSPPSAAVIGSALDLLEARAQFDPPRQDIYVRTAEHERCIYSDLADELRRAFCSLTRCGPSITAAAWLASSLPRASDCSRLCAWRLSGERSDWKVIGKRRLFSGQQNHVPRSHDHLWCNRLQRSVIKDETDITIERLEHGAGITITLVPADFD
jgi:hypothetical protein